MRISTALLGLGISLLHTVSLAETSARSLVVGDFSSGVLKNWERRSFKGDTKYAIVFDRDAKSMVLAADSENAASGIFRKVRVDLSRTPYLNWSWKVTRTFPDIDEGAKAGDDFPARVYVVVERGFLGVNSISLNYVWASQHQVGSIWPSPFTPQVQLLAVDSGATQLGKWVRRKRDLRVDLKAAFGDDIVSIDAVALMTDTDNHGDQAQTYYGDIWFSAD